MSRPRVCWLVGDQSQTRTFISMEGVYAAGGQEVRSGVSPINAVLKSC